MVGVAPSSSDCVAYLSFDSNATDSVGSYNGTVNGATLDTSNYVNGGGSYSFTTNDYIELSSDMKFPSSYSIGCWFKTSSSANQTLISKNQTGSYHDFVLYYLSGTTIRFGTDDGSTADNLDINTGSLHDNEWHFIVCTWDGTTKRVYIDGSVSETTSTPTDAYIDGIGKSWQVGLDRTVIPMEGNIDEPFWFNVTLTADNVTYLYNGGSPTSAQQYPFTSGEASNIAKVDGVSWASIAKIDGVAKAGIAKINGVNVNS